MKEQYILGIDIGGTHTDAVLVDNRQQLVAWSKTQTTHPVERGVATVLDQLLQQKPDSATHIARVCVGSTHVINALLECRHLQRVGLIRLAGHHPITLYPCFQWSEMLRKAVLVGERSIDGGNEIDGSAIRPFNALQLQAAAEELIADGAEALAIVGVFSPLYGQQEEMAEQLLAPLCGDRKIGISISHRIGSLGFIERENATILNAAVRQVLHQGFFELEEICQLRGLNCPLYFTQNNGTLLTAQQTAQYPILTLSSGATNSFTGAVKLARVRDALVVDVGGTSTDVGIVQNGFPRRSLVPSAIGGVSLNFPMPDTCCVSLGGGSHLALTGDQIEIGPRSCGAQLQTQARCYGGDQLTLTDAAVAAGVLKLPDAQMDKNLLEPDKAREVLQIALRKIAHAIHKVAPSEADLPVVLVGGGAALFDEADLPRGFIVPNHASVANAYGAALAEVSYTVDCVVSLEHRREEILEELRQQAIAGAIEEGVLSDQVRLIGQHILPYHYISGSMARIVITAAGPTLQLQS